MPLLPFRVNPEGDACCPPGGVQSQITLAPHNLNPTNHARHLPDRGGSGAHSCTESSTDSGADVNKSEWEARGVGRSDQARRAERARPPWRVWPPICTAKGPAGRCNGCSVGIKEWGVARPSSLTLRPLSETWLSLIASLFHHAP